LLIVSRTLLKEVGRLERERGKSGSCAARGKEGWGSQHKGVFKRPDKQINIPLSMIQKKSMKNASKAGERGGKALNCGTQKIKKDREGGGFLLERIYLNSYARNSRTMETAG